MTGILSKACVKACGSEESRCKDASTRRTGAGVNIQQMTIGDPFARAQAAAAAWGYWFSGYRLAWAAVCRRWTLPHSPNIILCSDHNPIFVFVNDRLTTLKNLVKIVKRRLVK